MEGMRESKPYNLSNFEETSKQWSVLADCEL